MLAFRGCVVGGMDVFTQAEVQRTERPWRGFQAAAGEVPLADLGPAALREFRVAGYRVLRSI